MQHPKPKTPGYKKQVAVTNRTYNGRASLTITIPAEFYPILDRYAQSIDMTVGRTAGELVVAALRKRIESTLTP